MRRIKQLQTGFTLDYWFAPKYVVEVLGSEITQSPAHTCNWDAKEKRGLSLRFPRFKRWRGEKSPEQATTVNGGVEIFRCSKKEVVDEMVDEEFTSSQNFERNCRYSGNTRSRIKTARLS